MSNLLYSQLVRKTFRQLILLHCLCVCVHMRVCVHAHACVCLLVCMQVNVKCPLQKEDFHSHANQRFFFKKKKKAQQVANFHIKDILTLFRI